MPFCYKNSDNNNNNKNKRQTKRRNCRSCISLDERNEQNLLCNHFDDVDTDTFVTRLSLTSKSMAVAPHFIFVVVTAFRHHILSKCGNNLLPQIYHPLMLWASFLLCRKLCQKQNCTYHLRQQGQAHDGKCHLLNNTFFPPSDWTAQLWLEKHTHTHTR